MNVEVRIYKRYDTDLLALHDAGYAITKMMTEAVCSYANGRPCNFFIDEFVPFDMNDKTSIRIRLSINDSDAATISLIRNIKHGYRSNFCKQVLRNALVQQNLVCYFSDMSMLPVHNRNASLQNLSAHSNLKPCSQYRRMKQTLNIAGKNIEVKHEKGYAFQPETNPDPSVHIPPNVPQPTVPVQQFYGNSGTYNVPAAAYASSPQYSFPPAQPSPQYTQPPVQPTPYSYQVQGTSAPLQPVIPSSPSAEHPQMSHAEPKPVPSSSNSAPASAPSLAEDDDLMNIFDNL